MKLRASIFRLSNECLNSRKTLRALLLDLFRNRNVAVNIILAAYDNGIIEKINYADHIDDKFLDHCVQSLIRDFALTKSHARVAVKFWIEEYAVKCLGRKSEVTKRKKNEKNRSFTVCDDRDVSSTRSSLSNGMYHSQRAGYVNDGVLAGVTQTFHVKRVNFVFRWCPPGSFIMGSPNDEKGRGSDECLHNVVLTEGFWMLESQVTQEMWHCLMDDTIKDRAKQYNYGLLYGESVQCPMYYINWYECKSFCDRLSQYVRGDVTLPTEAQWEYACRAGGRKDIDETNMLHQVGWYSKNSLRITHPVKLKKPNIWGLYDMHGNVMEWCSDHYSSMYYYENAPFTDPSGPPYGVFHVVRGGGWRSTRRYCRSASRQYLGPTDRLCDVGFRPVLVREGHKRYMT